MPSEQEFWYHFLTAVIWVVGVAPLLFASWELGRQHTAARRTGYDVAVGMVEVFRIALRGEPSPGLAEAFALPPRDKPLMAAALGAGIALVLPAFFWSSAPPVRTPRGAIWLIGAGLLMGLNVYANRRAAAYLSDEPRGWDLFLQWRLMNPERYDARGRPFVRLQWVATVGLILWWLIGGALVLGD